MTTEPRQPITESSTAEAEFSRFTVADLAQPLGLDRAASAFRACGAIVIEGAIGNDELAELRSDASEVIASGPAHRYDDDYFFDVDGDGVERFYRVQYVCAKGPRLAMLAAVANPILLRIVERLLGNDFVLSGDALVFKAPADGREVSVHTDGNPERKGLHPDHLHFNLDLYLDDSVVDNGCLLAAPGSHRLRERPSALAQLKFDYPGLTAIPVRAGDVIVHDCMLVHGSRATASSRGRRTIYYEFRRRSDIVRDGLHDGVPTPAWLDQRQWLVRRAIVGRSGRAWAAREGEFDYRPDAEITADPTLFPLSLRRGCGRWR
jgi:ectoine hydroxylase-related dioxygenase (phytanoyl-CoA dioxygenase family)